LLIPCAADAGGFESIGYSNNNVGAYAERMLLSEPLLLEVPNGLPAAHAALTEPLAVGVHAVAKANIRGGEVPLVIGCGPVGLAVIAALRIKGLHPIVASDIRRRAARSLRKWARYRGRSRPHAALCDLGRARADDAGRKGGATAAAGPAAGAKARADF